MTIKFIIERVDRLCPNHYLASDKVLWLSELDGRINQELLCEHDAVAEFAGYNTDDTESVLLVPYPYCGEIYYNYLAAQIAKHDEDSQRYNYYYALFQAAYEAFAAYCKKCKEHGTFYYYGGRDWNCSDTHQISPLQR